MTKTLYISLLGALVSLAISGNASAGTCTETKVAVCDGGWKYNMHKNKDTCTSKDWFGNVITGQYTIPSGTFGLLGHPSLYGWSLLKDYEGKQDYWRKSFSCN